MTKCAYVYILASQRLGTLYTGVTSDLARRMHQHRQHEHSGFTSRHDVTRLVWFLQGEDIAAAIALEKKIKNRSRRWKIDLTKKSDLEGSCDRLDRCRLNGGQLPTRRHAARGSCDCAQDDDVVGKIAVSLPPRSPD